ncbi:putative kinesin-4 [Salvia divinorum]|uniref:Kinesin-4 n=1 Tax=Salvia divinorum TaxID=28513 RepID=A0ABD1H6T1_SALDI
MRKQSSVYKSREDRYHSKIRALETLANGTSEENQVVTIQFQQMKVNILLNIEAELINLPIDSIMTLFFTFQ